MSPKELELLRAIQAQVKERGSPVHQKDVTARLGQTFQDINALFVALEEGNLIVGMRYVGTGNLSNIRITRAGQEALRQAPSKVRVLMTASEPYLKWIGMAAGAVIALVGVLALL